MLEMYGFIAAFTAQILIFSVLGPLRLIDGLRGQIEGFIAERTPPIDPDAASGTYRRLRLFRLLGLGTAVVGLLLLIVMIGYMLRPDWHDGPIEGVVPFFFLLQVLPILLAFLTAGRFHEVLKRSLPPQKRKAVLQPRGLFDFVPRSTVVLAVVVYVLFISFLLYLDRHPFPGFAGALVNIVGVTLIYALVSLSIYVTLRKMASSPLQGREDRMRSVGLAVRICISAGIVCVVGLSLNFALVLLDQQRWEPTFGSISLIVIGLLTRLALKEQMRIPENPGPAALTN